jgi:hypothetical protein
MWSTSWRQRPMKGLKGGRIEVHNIVPTATVHRFAGIHVHICVCVCVCVCVYSMAKPLIPR